MANLTGVSISEAIYLIYHLHRSSNLPGDICEFGVAEGATSVLLANEIAASDKILWLVDSFQGLPEPTAKDTLINDIFALKSMAAYAGTMAYPETLVQKKLALITFPEQRTRIVKGFVEQLVAQEVLPKQVCFAYVDLDLYEPVFMVLNFLASLLVTGGTVVVDDYGFFSTGVKTAVDEFMANHKNSFSLTLPHHFSGCFAILTKNSND